MKLPQWRQTDTARISCIAHHTKLSRCWQYGPQGKASPVAFWEDTHTKAGVTLTLQMWSSCQIKCDWSGSRLLWSIVDLQPAHSLTLLLPFLKLQIVHFKENNPLFQISSSYPKSNTVLFSVFTLEDVGDAQSFSRWVQPAINWRDILPTKKLWPLKADTQTQGHFGKINEGSVSEFKWKSSYVFGCGGWPMYVWEMFDWHLA